MGNQLKQPKSNQEWDHFSQTSGSAWSAPRKCEFLWLVLTPQERQLSSTSSSSVKSSTPSQQLASTSRPLSTRTFHSMCGTSAVRTRSDFSGDTITPTHKVLYTSSTPTIGTELMRTARSSTRCSPRKNSRTLCYSFSPTNRTCQAP